MTELIYCQDGCNIIHTHRIRPQMTITTEVFLVKNHSWDYDFHDEVVAVFLTLDEARKYINEAIKYIKGSKYNHTKETGLIIERWDIGHKPNARLVCYAGDEK